MSKKFIKVLSAALCLTMIFGSTTLFAGPTKKETGSAKHPPKFAYLPGTVMLPGTDEIIVVKEETPDPRKDQGSAKHPPHIGPMGPRKEQGSAKHPPVSLDPPGNDVPPKKVGPQGDFGPKGEQEASYGKMPKPRYVYDGRPKGDQSGDTTKHIYDGRPTGDSFKDVPDTGR